MTGVSSPARLLIPAQRPTRRAPVRPCEPWFLRAPAIPPVTGPASESEPAPPRLLAFDNDRFLEDFLAVAAGTAAPPRLLAWRDWSEPPAALLDPRGAPRYPASIARRVPEASELAPTDADGLAGDGVPAATPAGAPPWLRKLYLPMHQRFNLVAFDLVCAAPGWPPVDRRRVLAAGALIRRLVPRADGEHWQDWIARDDQAGAWLELLDGRMRPPTPPPAPRPHVPVDPAALPVADLTPAAQAALRELLALPTGSLPPVGLTSAPLALAPPAVGAAARHCTLFGWLPVFSAAQQVTLPRLVDQPPGLIAATLANEAGTRLTGLLAAAPGLSRLAEPLRRLLEHTLLPARPSANEVAMAHALVGGPVGPFPAPAQAQRALTTAVDLLLRRALFALCGHVWQPARFTADVTGAVADGPTLWAACGAGAPVNFVTAEPGFFDPVPDQDPTGGDQTRPWLRQSVIQFSHGWERLMRERLHQLVADRLAGTPWPAPPPDHPVVLTAGLWDTLLASALLRLRGARLALAASINRFQLGQDRAADLLALVTGRPRYGLAALGDEVAPFLELEDQRGPLARTPPWRPFDWPGIAVADRPRLRAAHQAGLDLTAAWAAFDDTLATIGSPLAGALAARVPTTLASLRGAFNANPPAALGLLPEPTALGLDLLAPPTRGLLLLPGLTPDPAATAALVDAVRNAYLAGAAGAALALGEARGRETAPRLRFDADHLYAVWCWVRLAGDDPCAAPAVVWTGRSEPFAIADPTDLLGARPAVIRAPDIPKLLRDLPRLARAQARPFAAVDTPPGSGVRTGAQMADTEREWGIGSVCSFGIPVLTLCALVLFNIIFHILIVLPGFAWMLLLKFCIPLPRRS